MAISAATKDETTPVAPLVQQASWTAPKMFRRYQQIKYEHLVAGVAGGVISSAILHPLDTMRTRLAVSGSSLICPGVLRPNYGGLVDVLTTMTRHSGLNGLYRGVTLGIITAGCTWGSYFFFFEAIKSDLQQQDGTPLGPARHMMAAAEAGIITLILTNPIWVVKTRLCLQFDANTAYLSPVNERTYKGIKDALVKTYQYEGMRGLYRGFVPGVLGVSHSAVQFMVYEEMKNAYCNHFQLPVESKMSPVTYLSFAAFSELFAVTATYPYRLLRTRMQDLHHQRIGTMQMFIRTLKYEGVSAFYKGMLPTLLRITPATAITFVVYENVSHYLLERSATTTSNN